MNEDFTEYNELDNTVKPQLKTGLSFTYGDKRYEKGDQWNGDSKIADTVTDEVTKVVTNGGNK